MARRRHRSSSALAASDPGGARARTEVAQVAARLMAEDDVHDFGEAKARAAASLGVADRRGLPGNDEVEAEIRSYQALFQAEEQPRWLAEKRRIALAMMDLLADFRPYLAGAVLRGTAAAESEITLHLFVDPPERVATFFYDRHIPWELDAWEARFGGNRVYELPMYRILPEGQSVRLIVFPEGAPREAPRSVIDGRPMQRAGRDEVAALLRE
ncbi:MAG: hypothetical protein U5K33_02885 [Halofilum sp. (in: g-proteobacteria)]|nr:hypothetical protein [Halofilum sp. (in: g-proteobacteria)]